MFIFAKSSYILVASRSTPGISTEDQAQAIEARSSRSPNKIDIYRTFVSSWPQLCRVRLLSIYTAKHSVSDFSFKVLENQMIGRVYRPPQEKDVLSYDIMADKTQDMFMNKLSIAKLQVMDNFTGEIPAMCQFFRFTNCALITNLCVSFRALF